MADPFIGEIRAFAFDYAPLDWALCDGAQIPVQSNPALYAVIGSQFGGDNRTYFKLPDLRGRAPRGFGQAPGQQPVPMGLASGTKNVTLSMDQMPAHRHVAQGAGNPNAKTLGATSPKDNLFGQYVQSPAGTPVLSYSDLSQPNTSLASSMLSPAGQGGPHENRQPYLTFKFCIALVGDFPVKP